MWLEEMPLAAVRRYKQPRMPNPSSDSASELPPHGAWYSAASCTIQERVDALPEEQARKGLAKVRRWLHLVHEAQDASDALTVSLLPFGGLASPYGNARGRWDLTEWCEQVRRACHRLRAFDATRLEDLFACASSVDRSKAGSAPVTDEELHRFMTLWELAAGDLQNAQAVAEARIRLARGLEHHVQEGGTRTLDVAGRAERLARAVRELVGSGGA